MQKHRARLTPKVVLSQLERLHKLITTSEKPVRFFDVMSSSKMGTTGIISSPVLMVLRQNGVITNSHKEGYKWNPKIPPSYKLAQTIATKYEEYKTKEPAKALPCQAHAKEQEKEEIKATKKRVYNKKPKETPPIKKGWLKQFIDWIW